MRSDSLANAYRLDAIRHANEQRRVAVIDVFDLTPHVRRLVFRELEPSGHEPAGPAEWIKLYVPLDDGGRTHGRAYTIRERSGDTLTVDMALHGGLCATWAQRARPGDEAEIAGPRKGFKLGWPVGDVLLGADETGLPAVATILASLPRQTRGSVWLEIPDEADAQVLDAPPAVGIRFLARGDALPGQRLTQAMREAGVSPDATVWVAAERTAALELREHFEAMLPRDHIHTSGYWRLPHHRGISAAPSFRARPE